MTKLVYGLSESQRGLRNIDRMLPNQPVMRQFFVGDEDAYYVRLEAVVKSVLPVATIHDKWDLIEAHTFSYETLGSDLSSLHLLQLLVRVGNMRRVLEVGTYIGVSTLFLAEAVGPEGRVVTIEIGDEFAAIARKNFARNDMESRIELLQEDVFAVFPRLTKAGESFDMIFLDADKGRYGDLLHPLLALLRPGGLFVVDDIFLNGDTLNDPPTTDKGLGVRNLLDRVAALPDYARVILPYGNGQLLLLKPK